MSHTAMTVGTMPFTGDQVGLFRAQSVEASAASRAPEGTPGNDGSIVVSKLLDANDLNRGFDAQTGDYVDMVKSGIIDPTKVVRLALQNAASVAGLLVTTEAMVAEKPKKETSPAMPPGGGMDGMDDY